MSFISYAQNFEDVRLWRAFADVAAGRYLDIGTQDPVRDSVSLAFYERGWRGVHVEPIPAYAAAMRAARPDELVIEAAVSNRPGLIKFYEIPGTGLSTGLGEIAERHAKEGWPHQLLEVPTVTLAVLFSSMGDDLIHWLKIDVEGMEADVLTSWGDHPARPAALVIEATAPNTQIPTHAAWYEMVTSRGYTDVLFDGLSRYFIHESQVARAESLALSPNVFDGFHIPPMHFASGALLAEQEAAVTTAERHVAQAAEATAAAHAADLAAAHADAAALQSRLEELADAHQEAMAHVAAAAARESGRMEGRLSAMEDAHASALEAMAEQHAATLARSDSAVAVLEEHHRAQRQELGAALARLEQQQAQAVEAAKEIGQLQGRLKVGAERIRAADTTIRGLTGERDHLVAELQALAEGHKRIAATLNDSLTSKKAQVEELERTCDHLTASVSQMEANLNKFQDILENIGRLVQRPHMRMLGVLFAPIRRVHTQLARQAEIILSIPGAETEAHQNKLGGHPQQP